MTPRARFAQAAAEAPSAREVLDELDDLHRLLAALRAFTTAQMQSITDDAALTEVMTKKQVLLDEIDARNPAEIFERSYSFEDCARLDGHQGLAREIAEAREACRTLFQETAGIEAETIQAFHAQLDLCRTMLADFQLRRQANQAYRVLPKVQHARFLDGRH